MTSDHSLTINDRDYRIPDRPVVVVCVDGSEPDYHRLAMDHGTMPFLSALTKSGTFLTASCVMPSFTNPNNCSIATGAPPKIHGICGNFFLDPQTGSEIMMNSPTLLNAPTIFAEFSRTGQSVAVITAKDKLRRLLGAGMAVSNNVCVSAERAHTATIQDNGIDNLSEFVGLPRPEVYSADLSEYALAVGTRILQTRQPLLTYISLSDYVQHKFPPGSLEADDFYHMLDSYLAAIHNTGAVLVVTADHGMNAKVTAGGQPNITYLSDALDADLGNGAAKVILPITDPYVGHHAALGSYAAVHIRQTDVRAAVRVLTGLPGVGMVLTRDEACAKFDLPPGRTADIVVVAERNAAFGTTPAAHDLTALDRPLRSHGGLSEQEVPFIVNRPVRNLPTARSLRNFDAFWVGVNNAAG